MVPGGLKYILAPSILLSPPTGPPSAWCMLTLSSHVSLEKPLSDPRQVRPVSVPPSKSQEI